MPGLARCSLLKRIKSFPTDISSACRSLLLTVESARAVLARPLLTEKHNLPRGVWSMAMSGETVEDAREVEEGMMEWVVEFGEEGTVKGGGKGKGKERKEGEKVKGECAA
jgi:hypothetical protein